MDRRDTQRIPLDMPCLLTLVIVGSGAYAAMAVDLSPGGVQVAFPPGSGEYAAILGQKVVLRDAPQPFTTLLDGATGKIAWVGMRSCGVRLDRQIPLAPGELASLVRF